MAGPSTGSATEMKAKTITFYTQTIPGRTKTRSNQTENPAIKSGETQTEGPSSSSVYSQAFPETSDAGIGTYIRTKIRHTQTAGPETTNRGTDPGNATIFDMTTNDEFDADMTDTINRQEDEQNKIRKNTRKNVESFW